MQFFNRQRLLRRVIFGSLLVLCALLQHTKDALPHFGNVHIWLLLPVTVFIAMHERSIPAMLFGAFAGALWDFASPVFDGFFAIALALIAFLCSILVSFSIRNNLPAGLLLSGGALALTALLHWLLFFALRGYEHAASALFTVYLPSVLLTFVCAPLLYWAVSAVSRAFAPQRTTV